MIRVCATGLVLLCLSPAACSSPTEPSVLLLANAVDPNDVNAVSAFHSCQGHPYPQQNATNSAKNYFWPTSVNFNTNTVIKLFAACDGTADQSSQDKSADQQVRGQTLHLYCDHSSTRLKYFHVNFDARVLGQHVQAGALLGYASLLSSGQSSSTQWQYSSNFDVAVSEGTDDNTQDYFSKLSASAFAAWSARGLSSASRTTRADNPTCASYNATFSAPDVIFFNPAR